MLRFHDIVFSFQFTIPAVDPFCNSAHELCVLTVGRWLPMWTHISFYTAKLIHLLTLPGVPNVTFSGFLNNTNVNHIEITGERHSAITLVKRPVKGRVSCQTYWSSLSTDPITCPIPPCTDPFFVTVDANGTVDRTNLTLSFPAQWVSSTITY